MTRCDTLETDNATLRRIVALQDRQLSTRATEIGLLKHRGIVADTAIGDLEKRANTKLFILSTDNARLKDDNTRLSGENTTIAAERDRLKGRTLAGKAFRKARNLLAVPGGIYILVLTLKLIL